MLSPSAPTQLSVRGNAGSNNHRHMKIRVPGASSLGRRTKHHAVTVAILALLLGGCVACFILLGESRLQLQIAAGLGILLTQFAFLVREVTRRQILTSATANDKIGRFVANVVVGISYPCWLYTCGNRQALPNTLGRGPDNEWGTPSFQTKDAQKLEGVLKLITERQGNLFVPQLSLDGINIHLRSMVFLLTGTNVRHGVKETASNTFALPFMSMFFSLSSLPVWLSRSLECRWHFSVLHGRSVGA